MSWRQLDLSKAFYDDSTRTQLIIEVFLISPAESSRSSKLIMMNPRSSEWDISKIHLLLLTLSLTSYHFRIASEKVNEVLNHLDYREKNGYSRYETTFYPTDGSQPKPTIVYVANEQNPSWNCNHSLDDIAKQIYASVGPSGRNIEYVFNLCNAMRQNFDNITDDHLFELENLLKSMEVEDLKKHNQRISPD